MTIKRHIITSMAAGLLGVALISGGTVAYFSDSIETETKIFAGILDLDISDQDDLKFEFTNKKPGDTFEYTFTLVNAGTLDMKDIILDSKYTTYDKKGKEADNDFAEQIMLTQLEVNNEPIINKAQTLKDLKEETLTLAENIKADETVPVFVEFEFIQTEEDQNIYQGNTLQLDWVFKAMQELD